MSSVPLPDGSRITTFSGVPEGASLRDTDDKFSVLSSLRPLKNNFLTMTLLRQLVTREGDGMGTSPKGDEALLDEVARLLVAGRFRWVNPSSENGETVQGKVGSTTPVQSSAPPPPPPKPLPVKKAPPPPVSAPPPVEKIVVIPVLKVEYKVVLLDRDLNQHLGGTDVKAKVSGTVIEVSFRASKTSPQFPKGLKLKTSGAGAVEAYENADLTKKLDLAKPIPNDKLGSPLKLWLKGKTKGKFDLTLEVESGDDRFKADPAVTEKMGVVELQMVPYEPDQTALDALEVDPDTDPWTKYYDDLRDKALPDPKELTDERKIKVGRMLHVQKDGHFGRAKLVVKKLDAAQWPDGTDAYKLRFSALKSADGADSTALKIFDAEFEGSEVDPPELKVSDAKAADKTFWVEGKEASKKVLDVRLGLGVDRDAGGLAKEIKKNGDWAQFTVLQIKEVKLDYTPVGGQPNAWDDAASKFSINFKNDPDGRKVKIKVTLSEKLKDVNVRFMLAQDKDNLKAANWGVDLPGTWKWKDIAAAVKHKDKADRKKVLHQAALTDVNGVATSELQLSRFGGDKFRPSAYLDCDPHLAKYVDGHTDLQKKKPVQAAKDLIVWRKFWYQVVKVEGMNPPAMAGAEGQYTSVKSDMVLTTELAVTRATVDTFNPKAIYPKYMVILNGGNTDALVVSDSNKAQFFSGYAAEAEKPIKIPILICDAQWDIGGNSAPVTGDVKATQFPVTVTTDKLLLSPPLQGGTLFVSGTWIAAEWDATLKAGAGDWTNVRNGNFTNANLSIDPNRTNLRAAKLALPAGVGGINATTKVWIQNLILQGANGPYLGEYSSATKRILAVYDPTQPVDFQNTIAHEIGHSFRQVAKPASIATGIPAHPKQYDKQGSHCSNLTNKCVMYESGPIAGSLNRYCDMCHPYVLVNNMKSQA